MEDVFRKEGKERGLSEEKELVTKEVCELKHSYLEDKFTEMRKLIYGLYVSIWGGILTVIITKVLDK